MCVVDFVSQGWKAKITIENKWNDLVFWLLC